MYLYRGSATGPSATPFAILPSPTGQINGNFGRAAAGAGDVNADGHADVIVGFSRESWASLTFAGGAYLYLGSASGLPAVPSVALHLPSPASFDVFGESVDGAGDLNADGHADIVVGSPSNAGFSTGDAYVYYGSATGLPPVPSVVLNSATAGDLFGTAVAGAGDVNGDGVADLVVGARGANAAGRDAGAAFLYLGSTSGIHDQPWVRIDNPTPADGWWFGATATCAGDVNGDGLSDVLIGAPRQRTVSSDEGSAFLYYGVPSGLVTLPAVTLDNPDGQLDGEFGWGLALLLGPAAPLCPRIGHG